MLQGQQQTNTREILAAGTYLCKLGRVFIYRGKPTEFDKEGKAKVMFIWQLLDEETAEVLVNDDGHPYEVSQHANFPKNLAYDARGNFWKTLTEITDVTISNDNVGIVGMDLGPAIQSYADVIEMIDEQDPEKPGKKMKVEFVSLKVGDLELMGAQADLTLKIRRDEKGAEVGNDIKSVTLKSAAPKKTTLGKKPAAKAPVKAPEPEEAPEEEEKDY